MMGVYPGFTPASLPAVPGLEGTGVVVGLGAGATKFAVGQRVVSIAWPAKVGSGTWQEYVCVAEAALCPVPEGVSDEAAAMALVNPVTIVGAWWWCGCGCVWVCGGGAISFRFLEGLRSRLSDAHTRQPRRPAHRPGSPPLLPPVSPPRPPPTRPRLGGPAGMFQEVAIPAGSYLLLTAAGSALARMAIDYAR